VTHRVPGVIFPERREKGAVLKRGGGTREGAFRVGARRGGFPVFSGDPLGGKKWGGAGGALAFSC